MTQVVLALMLMEKMGMVMKRNLRHLIDYRARNSHSLGDMETGEIISLKMLSN